MTETGSYGLSEDDGAIGGSDHRIEPFKVESALLQHPSVPRAAMVGSPDRIRGMIVKAFVG